MPAREITLASPLLTSSPLTVLYCARKIDSGVPGDGADHNVVDQIVVAAYQGRPELRNGSRGASYRLIGDVVKMPDCNVFHSPRGYYAILFHELIHSTGRPNSRLVG